jgi:hypothetical protein
MVKWIITATEPGSSNLKALLRFRLSHYQPKGVSLWHKSLNWFHLKGSRPPSGSHVWQRTTAAWKQMAQSITLRAPVDYDEWLSTCFWWNHAVEIVGPTFSNYCAATFSRTGLCYIRDVWVVAEHRCMTSQEAMAHFGLKAAEVGAWTRLSQALTGAGLRLQLHTWNNPQDSVWLGFYETPQARTPSAVVQRRNIPDARIIPQQVVNMATEKYFQV